MITTGKTLAWMKIKYRDYLNGCERKEINNS
jgi:hypothetical protein